MERKPANLKEKKEKNKQKIEEKEEIDNKDLNDWI